MPDAASKSPMYLPQPVGDYRTAIARRQPITYVCTCGRRELVGPPCAKIGNMRWTCECGQRWMLDFRGHGSQVKDELFKRGT